MHEEEEASLEERVSGIGLISEGLGGLGCSLFSRLLGWGLFLSPYGKQDFYIVLLTKTLPLL